MGIGTPSSQSKIPRPMRASRMSVADTQMSLRPFRSAWMKHRLPPFRQPEHSWATGAARDSPSRAALFPHIRSEFSIRPVQTVGEAC